MSNFEIGIIVFVIIAIIGFKTGGSHRKMRRDSAKEIAGIEAATSKRQEMDEVVLNKQRQQLRESRDAHLRSIRRKNALYMQNEGVLWTDETKEMLEYDKRHRSEWMALGMTPPSFMK